MPSCLGLTPMLHSTIGLTAGSVEHSPLHQWKASHGGHFRFKERTFFHVCKYLRQQQSYVMPLLHLMTSNNPKMDWCNTLYFNYGRNVTFSFDYTFSWLNDYFEIWDKVIWLTPEKEHLISSTPICGEQIEPPPEVSQQLNYNDWKQLGFLPQEMCNVIIPMFANPSSGPPFA